MPSWYPVDARMDLTSTDQWSVEVSAPAAEGAPSTVKVMGGSSEAPFCGSYPVQMVHGVTYPSWCSEQRRDKLQRELKLRGDDVLVVSYPNAARRGLSSAYCCYRIAATLPRWTLLQRMCMSRATERLLVRSGPRLAWNKTPSCTRAS